MRCKAIYFNGEKKKEKLRKFIEGIPSTKIPIVKA